MMFCGTAATLVSFVKEITEQYDIPCELIEMEITEGVLTGDTEEGISAMAVLNEIKVKLSIDDFDTGYSPLSYLKKSAVHILKIDRAFINECAINSDDAAICKAIIMLAKSLGLQVVAEEIEIEEQLLFLNQQGCDFY